MKRFFLCLTLAFSLQPSAFSTDVFFPLTDLVGDAAAVTNRTFRITTLSVNPRAYGTNFALAIPKSFTITNVPFTIAGLAPGAYKGIYEGLVKNSEFYFAVPDTNVVVDVRTIWSAVATEPALTYTTTAQDARFLSTYTTNGMASVALVTAATNAVTTDLSASLVAQVNTASNSISSDLQAAFVGIATTQTVTGPKVLNAFEGTNKGVIWGGAYSNATLTAPTINGGNWNSPSLTNAVLYGTFLQIEGLLPYGYYKANRATLDQAAGIQHFMRSSVLSGGETNVESGMYLGQVLFSGYGDTNYNPAVRVTAIAEERHNNTNAAGRLSFGITPSGAVATREIVRMTATLTSISNALAVAGAATFQGVVTATNAQLQTPALNQPSATNATLRTRTTFTGATVITPYEITSLASGGNAAVPIATNSVIIIATGPSAAFSLDGIDATGVVNGQYLEILNTTSYDMTIKHESGVDPVAVNRITTLTGADVATTGNGFALLRYMTKYNRWQLLSVTP